MNIALIFVGGGLGALCRFGLVGLTGRYLGDAMPWGTALVNVTGCFLIGLAAGAMERSPFPRQFWLFAVTGFLGGFTTFSSFALDTLSLARGGPMIKALANILLDVAAGFAAAVGGLSLALSAL